MHRDIKPGNLRVDDEGILRVDDLGLEMTPSLAAALEERDKTKLGDTMTQRVPASVARAAKEARQPIAAAAGTPEFMAPEQASDPTSIDGRADIYALGGTFYKLVTGRPPFAGETAVELIRKHQEDPLLPPGEFVPGLPRQVSDVIGVMMGKRPEERYPNMSVVVDVLEKLLGVHGGPAASRLREATQAFRQSADGVATSPTRQLRFRILVVIAVIWNVFIFFLAWLGLGSEAIAVLGVVHSAHGMDLIVGHAEIRAVLARPGGALGRWNGGMDRPGIRCCWHGRIGLVLWRLLDTVPAAGGRCSRGGVPRLSRQAAGRRASQVRGRVQGASERAAMAGPRRGEHSRADGHRSRPKLGRAFRATVWPSSHDGRKGAVASRQANELSPPLRGFRAVVFSALEKKRQDERDRGHFRLLRAAEEGRLEARGTNLLTARRKAVRIAKAMIVAAGQWRDEEELLGSSGSVPASPSLPLVERLKSAADHPEPFLEPHESQPSTLARSINRLLDFLLGRTIRFLLAPGCWPCSLSGWTRAIS